MKAVRVGDIIALQYGKALKKGDRRGGQVSVVGSSGVVGFHDEALSPGPAIVVGRKGSIGSLTWVPGDVWAIDTAYQAVPIIKDVDLRWLYWRLYSLGLEKMNKSAAVPGLNRDDVYRLPVMLPAIEGQRRIAAILDRADERRARRRLQLELLSRVEESMYVKRFAGISATQTVGDFSALMRTGPFGSQLLKEELTSSGVKVLGLENIASNRFRPESDKFVSTDKFDQLSRFSVDNGDVLISIMGSVGRCAVINGLDYPALNTKHMCAITPTSNTLDPNFMRATFLWHPEARRHLERQTRGSIMSGLNMGIIRAMPMPEVPIAVQREFVAVVEKIEAQRARVERALALENELFASLQHRAFRGEL